MPVVSNSVVEIELIDGTKLISDEKIGMNMDEAGIKGCIACEGLVAVYHAQGGYTLVSERDIKAISTVSETIDWSTELEWIDTKDGDSSEPLMISLPKELTYEQLVDYYLNGFFLRNKMNKEKVGLRTLQNLFRFCKKEAGLQTV